MTEPNSTKRAYNLAAAFGLDRARDYAERSAEKQAGTQSGERWEEIAETLSAMQYYDNANGGDDIGAPLFI